MVFSPVAPGGNEGKLWHTRRMTSGRCSCDPGGHRLLEEYPAAGGQSLLSS